MNASNSLPTPSSVVRCLFNHAAPLLLIGACALPGLAQDKAKKFDPGDFDAMAAGAVSLSAPGAVGSSGSRGVGAPVGPIAKPDPASEVKRDYSSRRALVITYKNGVTEEKPYVQIPILFVQGKTELLDDMSRENVKVVAAKLREYGRKGLRFSLEGHASAEGGKDFNQWLSEKRADRILEMITAEHQVDRRYIAGTRGFGSGHARTPPTAPESELQKDRRVLVVKER